MTPLITFVSAPGGSAFMEEILGAVADAVRGCGGDVRLHRGTMEQVAGPDSVFVVVPHEYFVLTGPPTREVLRRTIGFGVEHPGTETFETAARYSAELAGRLEISPESVRISRSRGLTCDRFTLGYVPRWDLWQGVSAPRPIDVAYLGTADEHRLGVLAGIADDLAGLRADLRLPPHEQMTKPRPDFLLAEDKWRVLAQSRSLLNLHRRGNVAFEWVRGLEAICNGAVVITETSDGIEPLVPESISSSAIAAGSARCCQPLWAIPNSSTR